MREKVLIVEDEMDLLGLVDYNLTRRGFITASALDGLTAMEKIESFNPDILVLDLMLPGLDGWEICRRLRQRKNHIPVLMLTAKCMPEDKVMGFESGADEYMTKPFNIKELVIRVDKLLEKRRSEELQTMLLHEMKNRISTIGGYSALMSKKAGQLDDGKASACLGHISRQVGYAEEFISEIGPMIDIESEGFRIRTEECDVLEIVSHTVQAVRKEAALKRVRITLEHDGALPSRQLIEANAFAIKQVFVNLIGNAVKYSKENGSVYVSVKGVCGGVAVSVRDNGLGIPKDEVAMIFKKGYRASNVRGNTAGSGLGLYIVKTLLDRMGATLTFGSVEGKGSAFTVFFHGEGGNTHLNKDFTWPS